MNVFLNDDLRDFVRRKVESGEFPSEEAVFQEAVRRFRQDDQERRDPDQKLAPDPIDHEAIAYCTREIKGKRIPSIEEVRRSLSRIRGAMSQVVIEERQDRS